MTQRNSVGTVDKVGGVATPLISTTDHRMGLAALLRRTSGMRARSGILRGPAGANLVVSGTAGWNYAVEAGALAIAPDAASGAYIPVNDSAIAAVATTAAPASGSRIDIIYAIQIDAFDRPGSGATAFQIVCVQGAPHATTPVAPAIPADALELARNTMTSAATNTSSAGNTITQTAPFTAAAGGIVHLRSAADETADAAGIGDGLFSYRSDTKRLQVGDGAVRRPVAMAFEGIPTFGSAAARDAWVAACGGLQNGMIVNRSDLGLFAPNVYQERYSSVGGAGAASTPGWYPWNAEDTFASLSLFAVNFNLGTTGGFDVARMRYVNGKRILYFVARFGGTGMSWAANAGFTLGGPMANPWAQTVGNGFIYGLRGVGTAYDVSAATAYRVGLRQGGSGLQFFVDMSAPTNWAAAVPFTPASGDYLEGIWELD